MHWRQLCKRIEDEGLMKFVPRDMDHLRERMQEESDGAPESETFDPLMNAHNAIVGNAVELGGVYLMGADGNGNHYCPVCEAARYAEGECAKAEWWIDHAVAEQVEKARSLGFLPRVQ